MILYIQSAHSFHCPSTCIKVRDVTFRPQTWKQGAPGKSTLGDLQQVKIQISLHIKRVIWLCTGHFKVKLMSCYAVTTRKRQDLEVCCNPKHFVDLHVHKKYPNITVSNRNLLIYKCRQVVFLKECKPYLDRQLWRNQVKNIENLDTLKSN